MCNGMFEKVGNAEFVYHPPKDGIQNTIFMRSGNRSVAVCKYLHNRLDDAFSMLSAVQQNGLQGSEFNNDLDKEATQFINHVIQELIAALGSKSHFS